MQLPQLRAFICIAREQNLTKASEILHLSQSAVSSQVKRLEESLGVRLFRRTSKNMLLTQSGEALLGDAQKILKATENLEQKAYTLSQGNYSSLVFGLNTDAAFLKISDINQRLKLLLSETKVTFQMCHSSDAIKKLLHEQIDLGFFYGETQHSDIEYCVIKQVRICVAIPTQLIPQDKELVWKDIVDLPWIWVDNDFPFFKVLQRKLGDHSAIPNQTVTAMDEQIVRELTLSGQGVAIMREDEARPLAEQDLVTIWNKGWGEIPLCLGWLRTNRDRSLLKRAIDSVQHIWRKPQTEFEGSLEDKYWV